MTKTAIVEDVEKLIEQAGAIDRQAKDKALVEYRALLLQGGDPRRLHELMTTLGKSIDQMKIDRAALQRADELQTKTDKLPDLEKEVQERMQTHADLCEEKRAFLEKIDPKINEAYTEFIVSGNQVRMAEQAKQDLFFLRRDHWQLFGDPEPVQPEQVPTHMGVVTGHPYQPGTR